MVKIYDIKKGQGGQAFFCPGCKTVHMVNTQPNAVKWTYNDDPEKPTFSPSILVTCRWSVEENTWKDESCHSFVSQGRIQFLHDCTHEMAGQMVDIPDWPYTPEEWG